MGETLFRTLLKRHIGRGLRNCGCSYCIVKRAGTAYVGFTRFPRQRFDLLVKDFKATYTSVHEDPSLYHGYLQDLAKDAVEWERERKRKIVRHLLEEALQEL